MAFIQKYKSGGGTRDLEKESREYAYETPKEPEVKIPETKVETKVETPTTVVTNSDSSDKLTINGIELSKKALIPYFKQKSFSATGVNRLAWDKILDKLNNTSDYNTSDSLDVDYGSDIKFDPEELKDRGNRVLAEILKEASSDQFKYKKEEPKAFVPTSFNKYLGTELGLEGDYDPKQHSSIFNAFEESNMEPVYEKNKAGIEAPKIKNKKTVYSTNLSTTKRSAMISNYIDKSIEEATSAPEDAKFLNGKLNKTEWLARLNDAKNAIPQLSRTSTIKNATAEFYRVGLDVNQLLGSQPTATTTTPATPKETVNADGSKSVATQNTDGTITTKTYSKDGKEISSVTTSPEQTAPAKPAVTNLFSTKPQGLPEHFRTTNYVNYIEQAMENPYVPLSKQWYNWFDNRIANPYDANTQKKEWQGWNDYYKGRIAIYTFNQAPNNLLDSIKNDKSITNFYKYIVNSKSNPYKPGTKSYNSWNLNKSYNPYLSGSNLAKAWNNTVYKQNANTFISELDKILLDANKSYNDSYISMGGEAASAEIRPTTKHISARDIYNKLVNSRQLSNTIGFSEFNNYLVNYTKKNPQKGQQGMQLYPKNMYDYFVSKDNKSTDINTIFNKFNEFAKYKDIIEKGKSLKYGDEQTSLFDKLTKQPLVEIKPTPTSSTPVNNATKKSSIIIKQSVGDINDKPKTEYGLGSYAISGIGDLVSAVTASSINKNITDEYLNNLKTSEVSPRIFESAKVFQDQSNLGNVLAMTPKVTGSDMSSYYGAQKEFNKNVADYILKEQNQQATGIRQDKARISAIEDARNKEYSDIERANNAAKIQMNNEKARINSEKGFKQGEISLDFLSKMTNLLAARKNETEQADQSLALANYNAALDDIVNEQKMIDNLPDNEYKRKQYQNLLQERIKLNTDYIKSQKGKYSKFFTVNSNGINTDIYK